MLSGFMGGHGRPRRLTAPSILAAVVVGLVLLWRTVRRGTSVRIVRCPLHGVAYDVELEACPDCAKPSPTARRVP